jgi:hypothetical protein
MILQLMGPPYSLIMFPIEDSQGWISSHPKMNEMDHLFLTSMILQHGDYQPLTPSTGGSRALG